MKIIKTWKDNGDEEECSIEDVKVVINGNYDNPNEVLKMFISGKIKEVQSVFAVYKKGVVKEKRKSCEATLEVDFGKYFDEGNRKKVVLECCLFHPHPKHKHFNSRLLLTCGGMNIPDEEGIKDWSAWIEEKGMPMPEWRKELLKRK